MNSNKSGPEYQRVYSTKPTSLRIGASISRLQSYCRIPGFWAAVSTTIVACLLIAWAVAAKQQWSADSSSSYRPRGALFEPATKIDSRQKLYFSNASPGRIVRVFGAIPPRALCRNAHWQWEDLSQQWFAGADCTNAQLQSAKLIGSNFRGANLSGAQMQDATMWFVNLDSARLLKANLRHADLARGSLRQARLEGADLTRAILKSANLTQANLLGAKVRNANFTGANLQSAILTGLDMGGVNFTRANLSGADLTRADLSNAVGLTSAQLKLANLDADTRLPEGMSRASGAPSQ